MFLHYFAKETWRTNNEEGQVIHDTDSQDATVIIDCDGSLDRLLGYTTELRSMTQGRGQFSMIFKRFDVA